MIGRRLDIRESCRLIPRTGPFRPCQFALLQVGEHQPCLAVAELLLFAKKHWGEQHGPILVLVELLDVVKVIKLTLALITAQKRGEFNLHPLHVIADGGIYRTLGPLPKVGLHIERFGHTLFEWVDAFW